jgi:hypothetical protein
MDFAKLLFTNFNCFTFVASVSFSPPATLIIRRSEPTLPTATTPFATLLFCWLVKAVKVVAGKNTTITEGTDGTYKTYKVDVDAPDYQLVENSSAADKAYTVSGNKVDLTVQDAKNPA